jgi:hypothetical protein
LFFARTQKHNQDHRMLPHTTLEPQDDPAFLAIVDRLIANLVRRNRPDEVHLIHIDNWFDRKWLRFSGYGIVPFLPGNPYREVAKAEHTQTQKTFPPFTPNRIVAQYLYCRMPGGDYEERPPAQLVHARGCRPSSENLHRRVADFTPSGLFMWYSSGSIANRRGSLLVYLVLNRQVDTWYAGFDDRQGWKLNQVEGIDREAVVTLATEGTAPPESP